MFCRKCGKEISATAEYCKHCGNITHRGYAQKKIKKYLTILLSAFIALVVIFVIIAKSGVIDNIRQSIADKKEQERMLEYADSVLKDYDFTSVVLENDDVSASLSFDNENVYISDGEYNGGKFMLYSLDNNMYVSIGDADFKNVGDITISKDVFTDLFKELDSDLEFKSYGVNSDYTGYTGKLNSDESINTIFGELFSIIPTDKKITSIDDVNFSLTIQDSAIKVDFYLGSSTYTVIFRTSDLSAKDAISTAILQRYLGSISATTCYLSDTDEELVIKDDAVFVDDRLQPKVLMYINNSDVTVDYRDIEETDEGIIYNDTLYPYGTKEKFEEEERQKEEREKEKEEFLALVNSKITLNKEYKVLTGYSIDVEEGLFFKELKRYYHTEDRGASVVFTNLEVEDQESYYKYIITGTLHEPDSEDVNFTGYLSEDEGCLVVDADYFTIGFRKSDIILTSEGIANYLDNY